MTKHRHEARGLRAGYSSYAVVCAQCGSPIYRAIGDNYRPINRAPTTALFSGRRNSKGFTLIEMIMVIVITGIIGSMVAVFLKAPIQQYMDVARRADMTDIADTALRRITRDVRLALPNSVRVAGTCDGSATCFLEFLPALGGGRYRVGAGGGAGCPGSPGEEALDFSAADVCFGVLGTMPAIAAGDEIVVYNLGIPRADAYAGKTLSTHNRRAASAAGSIVTLTSTAELPFDSPGHRFHVISKPVTYVCDGAGTLWRYWGYDIQDVQTKTDTIAELDALTGVQKARLATNVSSCKFTYDPNVVAQRSGLVTMHLAITEDSETATLYNAAHVSNQP